MANSCQDVLDFWFGSYVNEIHCAGEQSKLWWGKDSETDRQIKAKFEDDVQALVKGQHQDWLQTPRGSIRAASAPQASAMVASTRLASAPHAAAPQAAAPQVAAPQAAAAQAAAKQASPPQTAALVQPLPSEAAGPPVHRRGKGAPSPMAAAPQI